MFSPREAAAAASAIATAAVTSMQQLPGPSKPKRMTVNPVGFDKIRSMDIHAVREVIGMQQEIAGELGLDHQQVTLIGDSHYNCIAVGYKVPVTLDHLLYLTHDATRDGALRPNVLRAYIQPNLLTSTLTDWVAPDGETNSKLRRPALIVEVPTDRWIRQNNTQVVDVSASQPESRNVINYLFPFLQQATPTDPCGIEAAKQYVASATEEASSNVISSIRKIKPGSLTPGRNPLPGNLLVPYIDVSPSENDMPFPSRGLSLNDISAYGREQVDMACRLLCRFRAASSSRRGGVVDQVVRIYLETRYSEDISRLRCIGLGYVAPIDVIDMLSLYLVDSPLVVRQVSYDMCTDPGTDRLYNGGLCIELEIQSQEPVTVQPLLFVPAVTPSSVVERPPAPLAAKRPAIDPAPAVVIRIDDDTGNTVEEIVTGPTQKKQRKTDATETSSAEETPATPLLPPPAPSAPASAPVEPVPVAVMGNGWGTKALDFFAGLVWH